MRICIPRLSKVELPLTSTVPSDYMIDKMRKEHLLMKLDKSQIKEADNIGSKFIGLEF